MKTELVKVNEKQVIFRNARVAWLNLETARQYQGKGVFRYEATVLLEKGSDVAKQTMAFIQGISKATYRKVLPTESLCWKDGEGDEVKDKYIRIPCYAREAQGRPIVKNRSGNIVRPGEEQYPYGGCYANVVVDFYTTSSYKRVNAGLGAMQFVGDGEPISSGGDGGASLLDKLEDVPFDADL